MQDKRGKEDIETAAKVTLRCESVGVYEDKPVHYYCIDVKEAKMSLFEVQINKNDDGSAKREKSSANMDMIMKNRFCFIRNEEGKILSVFYPPDEQTNVVNFKKTITSAFQANFAKTETEEETDSQSKHKSHYTYSEVGDKTNEHRSVSKKDVMKYSGKGNEAKIDFESNEDIQVGKDKIIYRSHGESTTSLAKTGDPEEDHDDKEGEDADIPPIETKSSYTLVLKHCQASSKSFIAYDIARSTWTKEPIADSLIATVNEHEHDQIEMRELYAELPDLVETFHRAARSTDESTHNKMDLHVAKWGRILQLEYQHGPLNGRKPKISSLIELLQENLQSEEHKQLRIMLYSLLSSEGSLLAQKALLNALQVTTDVEEYDNIVIGIAMLQSAHMFTVSSLKRYMLSGNETDEQLLLAFATLGRHKNVEDEVVGTIAQMLPHYFSNDSFTNDMSRLVFLIHALGNTGSKLMIPYISPFLFSLNNDVQLAAIDALRTVSTYESVHKLFSEVIDCNASIEALFAIVESLIFPYESFTYYPEMVKPSCSKVADKLVENIGNASIDFEDSKLFSITKKYLKYYDTDKSVEMLDRLNNIHPDSRIKRAQTTHWSSSNSAYNVIASRSSRVSDLKQYPYHRAYLWTRRLGPSKVHATISVGGFTGVGATGYKLFGKGVINLHGFGRTYRAVDMEYQNRFNVKSRSSRSYRYVKVAGSTYLRSYSNGYGYTWRRTLTSIRVFNVHFRVWVWIGYLRFYIEGRVNIDASLFIKLSSGNKEANAAVRFGPTFSVTGGTSYTILAFQVGLEIKASIGYYITPKASAALCDKNPKGDATLCFGIMHGSNGIKVNVYAFFRRRRCRARRWRLRCWWGRKKKLSLFSSRYSVGFLRQRLLWGRCRACNCSGDLQNYCSAASPAGRVPGASNCRCHATSYAA